MAERRWSDVRDRWLADATRTLEADDRVVGLALVGSFGRAEADRWSDIDLLVAVADGDFDAWIADNNLWRQAEFLWLASQNTRATAASVGAFHVEDGLPVVIDWYVYPAAEAAWPVDALVISGHDAIPATDLGFREWNAVGPRGKPAAMSARDRLGAHAAMTTIAGKYIARGSADASGMIEFLTGERVSDDPATQLLALREFVQRVDRPSMTSALLLYLEHIREWLARAAEIADVEFEVPVSKEGPRAASFD